MGIVAVERSFGEEEVSILFGADVWTEPLAGVSLIEVGALFVLFGVGDAFRVAVGP